MDFLTISTNILVLEFISNNIILLTFGLGIWKVIAEETPWAIDNKLHQVFTGFLSRNTGNASKTKK